VTGLPSGPVTLTLSGQATLSLRRMVRSRADARMPAGMASVQIGGHPLTVRLFTNGGGEDASGRSGISVDQGDEAIDAAGSGGAQSRRQGRCATPIPAPTPATAGRARCGSSPISMRASIP
jgi:hypothetical protein